MVIIYESDYTNKVQDFISNNNFVPVPRDVTSRLQHDIKNTINECKVIIPIQGACLLAECAEMWNIFTVFGMKVELRLWTFSIICVEL